MWTWLLVLACGCGRIGFDPGSALDDAGPLDDADGSEAEARGVLDPSFGLGGTTITNDQPRGVDLFDVVPRAGGYLAVGVHQIAPNARMALVGYTSDGLQDVTFDGDGLAGIGPTADDFGYGALRIDASRILITGDGDDAGATGDDFTLAIIDDDGMLDQSFGTNGYARIDVGGMQRADTGNKSALVGSTVIVCGVEGYNTADSKFALVRLDLTGALVTSWGTGGQIADDFQASVQDECIDVVGFGNRVIAVGTSNQALLVVVAYDDVTGARDPGFATGGVFLTGSGGIAYGVAIVAGDIVVVGENNGEGHVVRLAPDGTPRLGFGSNGELSLPAVAHVFSDVVAQPNGKILVTGSRGSRGVVARLLSDGSLDPDFGTAGVLELPTQNLELSALSLDPDGRIVIVGFVGTSMPYTGFAARIR